MGSGTHVRISVVMPVYNAAPHVAEAVESVLAQTYRDFEFIIIDDGSTDGSAAILDRYARADARVRLRTTPNQGVVSARNLGLDMACGDLLGVIDSDDAADPRWLDIHLRYMVQHRETVAVGSYATMVDEQGDPLGNVTVPTEHDEIEAAHLRGIDSIFNSAAMFRTEASRRVGGYRPGIMPGEDYDLWLRLGEVGRLANVAEPLLRWRRTLTGLTASSLQRQREMNRRILGDAWARRGLPGEPVLSEPCMVCLADLTRQWGWAALKYGHRRTALKYAVKSVLAEPLNMASWRLAACVVRGR